MNTSKKENIHPVSYTIDKIINDIEFAFKNEKNEFIKTDFNNLFLKKAELIVIAARSSIGKTAFALELVKQLSFEQEIPLHIITCGNTSFATLSLRLLSSYSNVPVSKLQFHPDELSLDELQRLQEAAAHIHDKPLYFDDLFCTPRKELVHSPSITDVTDSIIFCREKYKSKIVIIEEFLWIDDESSLENNTSDEIDTGIHKFRTKMDLLKKLAENLGIPIIILVNLPKSYETRKPELSDFTGELQIIPEMADKVLLLHREKENRNSAILHIAKDKNGPCSQLALEFDSKYLSFRQI